MLDSGSGDWSLLSAFKYILQLLLILAPDESSSVTQMVFPWTLSRFGVYVFNFQKFNDDASWILEELYCLGFNQLLELAGLCHLPSLGSFQPCPFFSPRRILTTRMSRLPYSRPDPRHCTVFSESTSYCLDQVYCFFFHVTDSFPCPLPYAVESIC